MKKLLISLLLFFLLVGCTNDEKQILKMIEQNEALAYALKEAGFDINDIDSFSLELKKYNDIDYYEVEIEKDNIEYEILVDAISGVIIKNDIEIEEKDDEIINNNEIIQKKDLISLEDAKNISLKAANLNEATFKKAELDLDDDDCHYEIELYYGDKWCEIKIDAISGEILEYDANYETNVLVDNSDIISEAKAKEYALEYVKGANINHIKKCKLDDSKKEYEIEIIYGSYEYEIEIDAYSGKLIEIEKDELDDDEKTEEKPVNVTNNSISSDEAKRLALSKVPGASLKDIVEFEVDEDDGKIEYEGKIIFDGYEYEFEIDGYSGSIREWESEKCD